LAGWDVSGLANAKMAQSAFQVVDMCQFICHIGMGKQFLLNRSIA